MEANIDNNEIQQEAEQDRITAAAACKRRLRLISVLERSDEIPFRSRDKTDELVEIFLCNLGDDVHDMIWSNDDREHCRGLDSDRDTEVEVEATIRFFPEVLSRTKEIDWNDDRDEEEVVETYYPLKLLTFTRGENILWCSVKAVDFIPLLVRLAIELGLVEEVYRGDCYTKLEKMDSSWVIIFWKISCVVPRP